VPGFLLRIQAGVVMRKFMVNFLVALACFTVGFFVAAWTTPMHSLIILGLLVLMVLALRIVNV
jgi:hypothetical protein